MMFNPDPVWFLGMALSALLVALYCLLFPGKDSEGDEDKVKHITRLIETIDNDADLEDIIDECYVQRILLRLYGKDTACID